MSLLSHAGLVTKASDILADMVSQFVGRKVLLSIGLKVPAPPVHDQSALLDELSLVDIGSSDVIPLLVAHLPFNGGLGPQS